MPLKECGRRKGESAGQAAKLEGVMSQSICSAGCGCLTRPSAALLSESSIEHVKQKAGHGLVDASSASRPCHGRSVGHRASIRWSVVKERFLTKCFALRMGPLAALG